MSLSARLARQPFNEKEEEQPMSTDDDTIHSEPVAQKTRDGTIPRAALRAADEVLPGEEAEAARGSTPDAERGPDYFPRLVEVCPRCACAYFTTVRSPDGYDLRRCTSCQLEYAPRDARVLEE
jgi:hypothetical protein